MRHIQILAIFFSLIATLTSVSAQDILDVKLTKVDIKSGPFCQIFFEVNNKTNHNFTSFMIKYTLQDGNGNLIKEYKTLDGRLPPNSNNTFGNLIDDCPSVKSLKVGLGEFVEIDGKNSYLNKNVATLISKIQINVASNVGRIYLIDPNGKRSVEVKAVASLTETALNPLSSTQDVWAKFKDEGGLNTDANFYGLQIRSVNASFDNTTKRLKSIDFQIPKTFPPKKIREALSDACKLNETDWRYRDQAGVVSGEAENSNISCRYVQTDNSQTTEIVMVRK